MSSRKPVTGSLVLVVVSALVFSTGGLFVRGLHANDPWTTVFWRSVSAVVSLGIVLAVRERSGAWRSLRTMGWPGVQVGISFSVSSITLVAALSRASVAVALVIMALTPLVVAILARLFLGEPVRGYTWTAIALTVVGVAYMVSGPGASSDLVGVLISLVVPVAFAAGTVLIRRHPEIGMIPAMLLACLIGAVVSWPLADPLSVDRHDLILLCLFGSAQLGIGLAIFAVGAAGAPATEASLLAMLEPVTGPIWVWVFFGEYPGMSAIIGGLIVFVTLAAHTVYAARRIPRLS